jgi:hypothetical protein
MTTKTEFVVDSEKNSVELKLDVVPEAGALPPNTPNAQESAVPEEPPRKSPTDIFTDLGKLKKDNTRKVHKKKIIATNVAVQKPSQNVFFQCHPDLCLEGAWIIKGDKGSNDLWFIAPSMLSSPLLAKRLRPVTIAITYIWPSGEIGLWPVPTPPRDTKVKAWKSLRAAYERAKAGEWVQVIWNEETMDFDVNVPEQEDVPEEEKLPAPSWPKDLDLSSLLMIGFEGRVIDSIDHPFMLQLRGIVDK